MKRLTSIIFGLLAASVGYAADDWMTDSLVVRDGVELALQSRKSGQSTTYQMVFSRFVSDVVRIPERYLKLQGTYQLKALPSLSGYEGNLKTVFLNADTVTTGTQFHYLWGGRFETVVFPPDVTIKFAFSKEGAYAYDQAMFRDCVGLKRAVFGPVPKVGGYQTSSVSVITTHYFTAVEAIRAATVALEELYYPQKYAAEWEAVLKGIPTKCKYGAFEGDEWTGLDCVVPGSGNLAESGTSETPSVVTNVVTYYASVTNVHVHYVSDGDHPTFLNPPTTETGFVNAITEINGGFVSIPESWADNYDGFKEKFGEDFSVALAKPTGKHDQQGNPLFVWQDYVAGTNPVDENDVFRATVTIDGDKVIVSYSPKLDAERAAMRKYTIWGKKSLMEKDWIAVPEGGEANYNFFKVSVEMR